MTTTTVHIATSTAAKAANGENGSADACALKDDGNAPSGETNGENKDGETGIEPIGITTGATILTRTSAFVTGDSLIARDARLGIIRITFAPGTAGSSPAHRD